MFLLQMVAPSVRRSNQSVIMTAKAYSPSKRVCLPSSVGLVLAHLNDSDKLSRSYPWASKSKKSQLSELCQLRASLSGERNILRLSSPVISEGDVFQTVSDLSSPLAQT